MPKRNNKPRRPRVKDVSIRVEHRKEPDWDRYAYALLRHVKNERDAEAEHKKRQERGEV
jgi:hypothetical protein